MHASEVLYCAGVFSMGDPIYIAFRTADGSQYVVATGNACCDAATLKVKIGQPAATPDPACDADDNSVIVREQDIELLWPSPRP